MIYPSVFDDTCYQILIPHAAVPSPTLTHMLPTFVVNLSISFAIVHQSGQWSVRVKPQMWSPHNSITFSIDMTWPLTWPLTCPDWPVGRPYWDCVTRPITNLTSHKRDDGCPRNQTASVNHLFSGLLRMTQFHLCDILSWNYITNLNILLTN